MLKNKHSKMLKYFGILLTMCMLLLTLTGCDLWDDFKKSFETSSSKASSSVEDSKDKKDQDDTAISEPEKPDQFIYKNKLYSLNKLYLSDVKEIIESPIENEEERSIRNDDIGFLYNTYDQIVFVVAFNDEVEFYNDLSADMNEDIMNILSRDYHYYQKIENADDAYYSGIESIYNVFGTNNMWYVDREGYLDQSGGMGAKYILLSNDECDVFGIGLWDYYFKIELSHTMSSN